MPVQFAYDGQIRRFVMQFVRMVSNFQVEFGKDANGDRTLQTVPVYYGDMSRQAAMILRGNSENTLNAVPAMACYISGLAYDQTRLQNPYHEGVVRIRERVYNDAEQEYERSQDGIYTVERLMPAPYKLTMKLDIWTSNTEQKHQLIEQMMPLFNPGLEIQSTDNYVDWTSLSVVLLTDLNYSSRSVPTGGEESIDVASLTFEMPIWLSLPAKVKKMGVVAQIIASIYDAQGDLSPEVVFTTQGLMSQQRFTPMNYELAYVGNTLTLYKNNATESEDGTVYGTKIRWADLVNLYGKLTNGISEVRLTFAYPDGPHEIAGTVAYNPTDDTQLLFTPFEATLPANTLTAVDAIIDPRNVDVDSMLLSPAAGTRYLILDNIGQANAESAVAWAGPPGTDLIARANDIIEYNGSYWTVSFDSREPAVQYVTNINTTIQYRWTGEAWVKSYEGFYGSGEWSLVL
jgi:T4-like virus Myoviridae tail sheath stabiliser